MQQQPPHLTREMALFLPTEVELLRVVFEAYALTPPARAPCLGLYELYALLPHFGPERPLADVADLIYRFDSTLLGFVDFDDFLELIQWVIRDAANQQEKLLAALRVCARNSSTRSSSSSVIDAYTLRQLLMAPGSESPLTYSEFAAILRRLFPLEAAGTSASKRSPEALVGLLSDALHPVVASFIDRLEARKVSFPRSLARASKRPFAYLPGVSSLLKHASASVHADEVVLKVRIFEALDVEGLARVRPLPHGAGIEYEALSLYVVARISPSESMPAVSARTPVLVRELYPEWHQDLELRIPLPSPRLSDIQVWASNVHLHFEVYDAVAHMPAPHAEWIGAASLPLSVALHNAAKHAHFALALSAPGGLVSPNAACYKFPERTEPSRLARAKTPVGAHAKSPGLTALDSFYPARDRSMPRSPGGSDGSEARGISLPTGAISRNKAGDLEAAVVLESAIAAARERKQLESGGKARILRPRLVVSLAFATDFDAAHDANAADPGEVRLSALSPKIMEHYFVPPDVLWLALYPGRMEEDLSAGLEVESEPVPDGSRQSSTRQANLDSLLAANLDDVAEMLADGGKGRDLASGALWELYLQSLEDACSAMPRRAFQLVAIDEYNRFRWLPSFVCPMPSTAAGHSEVELLAMVSALSDDGFPTDIACGKPNQPRMQTLSPAVVISRKAASELEKALLLASLLIGAGADAYVVVGRRTTGAFAYWVVTLSPLPYKRRRKRRKRTADEKAGKGHGPDAAASQPRSRSRSRSQTRSRTHAKPASRRPSVVDAMGNVLVIGDANGPAVAAKRRASLVDASLKADTQAAIRSLAGDARPVPRWGRRGSTPDLPSGGDSASLFVDSAAFLKLPAGLPPTSQAAQKRRGSVDVGLAALALRRGSLDKRPMRDGNDSFDSACSDSSVDSVEAAVKRVQQAAIDAGSTGGRRRRNSLAGVVADAIALHAGGGEVGGGGNRDEYTYSFYSTTDGGADGGNGDDDGNEWGMLSPRGIERGSHSRSRTSIVHQSHSQSFLGLESVLSSEFGGGARTPGLDRYSSVARMHNPLLAFEPRKFSKRARPNVRPMGVVHFDAASGAMFTSCDDAGFPFASVGTLFNGDNGWLNVAQQDRVDRLVWDLSSRSDWKPFFSDKVLATAGPVQPWYTPPRLEVRPALDRAATRAIALTMEAQLTELIKAYRASRAPGWLVRVHEPLSNRLRLTIKHVDMVERGAGALGVQHAMDTAWPSVLSCVPNGAFLHARLFKFRNTSMEAVCRQLAYTGLLDVTAVGVIYVIAANLVSRPLGLEDVWLWFGYLEWADAYVGDPDEA
ncbi:uncharacterized protein AMSG_09827 [Thecamonas trahens ATCC 50062]|uniref:C2 domain-containing protein n=1 Tax=Thecamonas trahens ATCC 50062 TaxID=461836 RepID=A0A0L0DNI4_THETB|nr:hypothetical protein AMSG_09827 [Thecamonas trahens ATCC 50062]KNC53874.1 hypothetical protein AMSG_09827 [Thecamonas trahens ATCC 50062]|eukprot:XP_013754253.1 hypothetical protein AMSG_09827 [Thecamonas trahens ATCC 50062]